MVARITSKHVHGQREGEITFAGSMIRNLTIAGETMDVALDPIASWSQLDLDGVSHVDVDTDRRGGFWCDQVPRASRERPHCLRVSAPDDDMRMPERFRREIVERGDLDVRLNPDEPAHVIGESLSPMSARQLSAHQPILHKALGFFDTRSHSGGGASVLR